MEIHLKLADIMAFATIPLGILVRFQQVLETGLRKRGL